MAKQVKSRDIPISVERELWARAAGRCQFDGHNEILYRSPVTQERVNQAQKAHIWSFSPDGPRGQGPHAVDQSKINDADNLLLMCAGCHKLIDNEDDGGRYTTRLLLSWKKEHEERVERVTSIAADRQSHVVCFGADIGDEITNIDVSSCVEAMFQQRRYPASNHPITIALPAERKDEGGEYWITQERHLVDRFARLVSAIVEREESPRFSIFGVAPQPLLILLGSLFTDKSFADVYQLHRQPLGWSWTQERNKFDVSLSRPESVTGQPVLVISISASITHDRISRVLSEDVSIWEIEISNPFNDALQSREQLERFSEVARQALAEISKNHGSKALSIFPAMPVACAVTLGLVRQPKADSPWIIFDQNNKNCGFFEALRIGDSSE
tara:strand:+ start:3049 stop:4203 length:1155 start_codon:yes stop_codon:yes gene_type:complete